MRVEAVLGLDDRSRAALRGNRVAAHGIDLRDHRQAEIGVGLGNRDSGTQAGTAAANDQDVMREDFHRWRSIEGKGRVKAK